MSQHLMTVCVFCLLCATHAPCSAHTELINQKTLQYYNNGLTYPHRMNLSDPPSVKLKKFQSDTHDILQYIGNEDKYANEVEKQVIVNKKPTKFGNKDDQQRLLNVNGDVRIKNSTNEHQQILITRPAIGDDTDTTFNDMRGSQLVRQKRIRKSVNNGETRFDQLYYIRKIFNIYNRTEDILPLADFKGLVKRLGLDKFFQDTTDTTNSLNNKNKTCITGEHILEKLITYHEHDEQQHLDKSNLKNSTTNDLTLEHFQLICPLLVYQLAADSSEERLGCIVEPDKRFHAGKVNSLSNGDDTPSSSHQDFRNSVAATWIYATISVIIISACGLLGVVVIPVMQKHFYHQLLQFLVALAIGTLCGDALLHLLPHAMLSHQHDSHTSTMTVTNEAAALHQHNQSIWKGFAAMLGIIFFYFVEKFLTLGAEWRKRRQRRHKFPSKVRVMRDNDSVGNNSVGEKLCKHKYSSYPYCYDEIATQDDAHNRGNNISRKNGDNSGMTDSVHNSTNVTMLSTYEELGVNSLKKKSMQHQTPNITTETNQNDLNIELKNSKETDAMFENNKTDLPRTDLQLSEEESYTVILREHESKHHGHSHAHGHVHAAPDSLSSVAWMVIMGDGLHNFTDGMAIGAAFASGIAGGFSTSVAVFCHELPHEIGDFAVLLKAGMSAKQAMFYNLLSSVLCFFGCLLGVTIGHSNAANEWVFAVAGGMFIYIALVDMIPELTSSHSKEGGSLLQCLLQFCGLMSGLGVMTLIAVYEHSIKTMFEQD